MRRMVYSARLMLVSSIATPTNFRGRQPGRDGVDAAELGQRLGAGRGGESKRHRAVFSRVRDAVRGRIEAFVEGTVEGLEAGRGLPADGVVGWRSSRLNRKMPVPRRPRILADGHADEPRVSDATW